MTIGEWRQEPFFIGPLATFRNCEFTDHTIYHFGKTRQWVRLFLKMSASWAGRVSSTRPRDARTRQGNHRLRPGAHQPTRQGVFEKSVSGRLLAGRPHS